ncbi:unnamed protein product [Arctogadus glacialis]
MVGGGGTKHNRPSQRSRELSFNVLKECPPPPISILTSSPPQFSSFIAQNTVCLGFSVCVCVYVCVYLRECVCMGLVLCEGNADHRSLQFSTSSVTLKETS